MPYRGAKVPAPLVQGVQLDYPTLGLDIKCRTPRTWNELPKVIFDKYLCEKVLEDHILPRLNGDDNQFIQIFEYLEKDNEIELNLRLQIQRLALRLAVYSKIIPKNGKALKESDYMIYNLRYGPDFANWLSKARAAMIIKTLSTRILTPNVEFIRRIENNDFGIILNLEKYDYDAFLNERYLIDFSDTGSDFEWAFKPIQTNANTMELFRYAARHLLLSYKVEDIRAADTDEYARWISDSITQTSDGPIINRTLLRKYAEENKIEPLMKGNLKIDHLTFKRQVVDLEPGNVRDTWQCYPETLFVVKRTSHILRQVLEHIPYSAMASPLKAFDRRKILKEKRQYFMFDFKKCGLTVNRELIAILGEELNNLYPGKGFGELLLWRHVTVFNGDTPVHPPRGTGLGNCNEGVTLLQCVIGHMMKLKLDIDSVFFNDDGVFCSKDDVRNPFTQILTTMNHIGMIVNLEKTILSKSNIFCEDYVTEGEIDYRKVQLTLIPFVDVFFKKNIAIAKSLYSTLERSLIGKRISINILPDIVRFWGFEFHKSEVILPYEFGGWKFYGRTSINEAIRYVFNPKAYLDEENYSYIGFTNEWIGFLVKNHCLTKLLSKGRKIRYRRFIPNQFKSWENHLPHSQYVKDMFTVLAIQTNDDINDGLDDLYNVKGNKNAKPRLLAGQCDLILKTRKSLWDRFRGNHGNWLTLRQHQSELLKVLEYIRDQEQVPSGHCPPDFMIFGEKEVTSEVLIPRKRIITPKVFNPTSSSSRFEIQQTAESIFHQQILKENKIFSLANEIAKNKQIFILSNKRLNDAWIDYDPPNWMYLFLPKKEYARILYMAINDNKKVPVYWENIPIYDEYFDKALNPIKYIFPNSFKRFKEILFLSEKEVWRNHVELMINKLDRPTESEFNRMLEDLLGHYELIKNVNDVGPFKPNIDYGFLNALENDDALAELIIGEKVEEDLLEEYLSEYSDGSFHLSDHYSELDMNNVEEYDDEGFDDLDRTTVRSLLRESEQKD